MKVSIRGSRRSHCASRLDPALGLNLKPFCPIRLRLDPLRYFQDFFSDIEGLPLRTTEERNIATHKLRQNGRIVEGPFLCEAFALARWFPGIGRRPELRLKRMAVVIPTDSGLPCAPQERNYLRSLTSEQRQVTEIPATYLDVVDALSRGEHDGWHFSGHGQFIAPDPNRSAILLERSQRLCAEEICGQVSNCGLTNPLVFLNACQTGREASSLTGMGGWAKCFVEAGAAGFIGSLWSVDDQAACQFAKTFYNHLLVGKIISQGNRAISPLDKG